jgi:AsmA protein
MRQTDPSQDVTPFTHPAQPSVGPEEPNPVRHSRLRRHLRHYRFLYISILAVLLLIFLPPLVNIGRYQRSIATSISRSLGRPVHLDRVSLTLLPLPGFTIENLVVGEDPAFGSEPIIRANSVHATVRLSSLWRRHVEFSTISFTDPSVNLVHKTDGQWNIEGILLQASRIETAPTAQRHAGPAPRFPYIEANGARLNFKQEQEKLPFSLVDSDFALWLPDPHQWHLRLRAHPTRTDLNVSDTGTIELEAILGAGPSLRQVALNLQGQWRDAPLGEASRVLFGRDAGWRGEMNLAANIRGTFGESAVTTRLTFSDARPADFVPEQLLNTQAECLATATGIFHSFQDIRCSWPPASSAQAPALTLTGSIPNIHHPAESTLEVKANGIPASTLMSGLRVLTPHLSPDAVAAGTLTGTMIFGSSGETNPSSDTSPSSGGHWKGEFTLANASLKAPSPQPRADSSLGALSALEKAAAAAEGRSTNPAALLLSQDLYLHAGDQLLHPHPSSPDASRTTSFVLSPTPLLLGGHDPALLEGSFTPAGYVLHLSGSVTAPRLEALAAAVPPVGEGLLKALPDDRPATEPFHIDLTATKRWHTPQTWAVDSSSHPQPRQTRLRQRKH